MKRWQLTIRKLIRDLPCIELIVGLFLYEVDYVLPNLRIAIGKGGDFGSEIMIRNRIGQLIESLSVDMSN